MTRTSAPNWLDPVGNAGQSPLRGFDPPPPISPFPWGYLGAVAALAAAGLVVAALTAIRAAHRPPLAVLREL